MEPARFPFAGHAPPAEPVSAPPFCFLVTSMFQPSLAAGLRSRKSSDFLPCAQEGCATKQIDLPLRERWVRQEALGTGAPV